MEYVIVFTHRRDDRVVCADHRTLLARRVIAQSFDNQTVIDMIPAGGVVAI